jgi:hypothetical protein
MIAAASNVAPASGVRSDNASRVGQSTTPWWLMLAACMSSRTRPWPSVALAKAASPGVESLLVPIMVAPFSIPRAMPIA